MNGPCDQFFPGTRFSQNEGSGIAGSDGLGLCQYPFEGSTLSYDLLEVELRADLIFQIKLLFGRSRPARPLAAKFQDPEI